MKRLFLDTSNKYLYIAIFDEDKELISVMQEGNNNHSETLVDKLNETLQKINLKPKDLDEIYVGRGPGSYTGVRVACTVAKVMAYTLNKPLYSFSSLDLIYTSNITNDTTKVVMDARRGFSYAKVMKLEGNKVITILDETYIESNKLNEEYDVKLLNIENNNYAPKLLLQYGLIKKENNVHSFTPTYLRSGV